LPFLYVIFVEKKGFEFLGFRKEKLSLSISLGLAITAILFLVYLPIFVYYIPMLQVASIGFYVIFTDVVWYPIYEEVAYRGFFLAHFTNPDDSPFSRRGLLLNLSQAALFLSVHHKHVTAGQPLLLIPVFLLGFLNGFIFLRTRTIIGCISSHSILNGAALILNQIIV
jgi:membrane protease YdiL (CAAX protease family)